MKPSARSFRPEARRVDDIPHRFLRNRIGDVQQDGARAHWGLRLDQSDHVLLSVTMNDKSVDVDDGVEHFTRHGIADAEFAR